MRYNLFYPRPCYIQAFVSVLIFNWWARSGHSVELDGLWNALKTEWKICVWQWKTTVLEVHSTPAGELENCISAVWGRSSTITEPVVGHQKAQGYKMIFFWAEIISLSCISLQLRKVLVCAIVRLNLSEHQVCMQIWIFHGFFYIFWYDLILRQRHICNTSTIISLKDIWHVRSGVIVPLTKGI